MRACLVLLLLSACSQGGGGAADASIPSTTGDGGQGGGADAAVQDGCPANPATAENSACSDEGKTCGMCNNPCGFCNLLHCQAGHWTHLEAFPDPSCNPHDGGLTCDDVVDQHARGVTTIAASHDACSGDAECALFTDVMRCGAGAIEECPVAYASSEADGFQDALGDLHASLCAQSPSACSGSPACPGPVQARCVDGHCRAAHDGGI